MNLMPSNREKVVFGSALNMKTLLLALLFITSASAADLASNKIVPRFYELLMTKDKPSEQDEADFFGGEESKDVAKAILLKSEYSKSKTPIWDFLRANKSFFITRGVTDLHKARIQYSEPDQTTRLWNQTLTEGKKVYAMFPTKRSENGACSGRSMVIFTLGENSHLSIGDTFVAGAVNLFTEQIYEMEASNGTTSNLLRAPVPVPSN